MSFINLNMMSVYFEIVYRARDTKFLLLSAKLKYQVSYALCGISDSHKTNKILGLRVTSPLLRGFKSIRGRINTDVCTKQG